MSKFELVYLWVEKYKNIENQGFNFSPIYECEYNQDTNKLIIEEKEYVSIYPKNINITAIVGENGSGKSNLLDLLYIGTSPSTNYFYIFDLGNELLIEGINISHQSNEIITNNKIKKTIFKKNKLIYLESNDYNQSTELKRKTISFIYFSNMFSECKNIESKCIIGSSDEDKFNISTSYLVNYYMKHEFEMKKYTEKHYVSFENQYRLFKNKNIQNCINMLKNTDIKLPIQIPEKLYISIYINKFQEESEKYLSAIDLNSLTLIEKAKVNIISNFLDYLLSNYVQYKDDLLSCMTISNFKSIDSIFDSFYGAFIIEQMKVEGDIEIQINPYIEYFNLANSFVEYIKNFEGSIKYEKLILNISEISIDFMENYQKLTLTSLDFLSFEWFPNLSSGQENLLFQFSNFYKLTLDRFGNRKLKENLFIFIDEGENTLHPNWQKFYIKFLIDFFSKNFTQKINLFFATHSPFILSDLSKENVIFLEKYKENDDEVEKNIQKIGNCKNVSKDTIIDTFGANIHTLLSHGFFMENGLMGEFAKEKINELIKYLNNKESEIKTIQEAQNIINIIGEPVLKNTLQNMIDDRYPKELKLKQLNEEKEKIETEIKKLEGK